MEHNNHTKQQDTHHEGVKPTDEQTKKTETSQPSNQPVQKPTTSHTK